jgi:hypothetical protein
MSNSKFKYALDRLTGIPVLIKNAQNGLACNCICAGCGKAMVAAQGTENEWHFRHYEPTNCTGGLETILHKRAKEIIVKASQMSIPGHSLFYSNARVETSLGVLRPDVTVEFNGQDIHIEIRVTNAKKDKQIQYYKSNELKSIEINLSGLAYDMSLEELTGLVLNDTSNKTIFFWEVPPVVIPKKTERTWLSNPIVIFSLILATAFIIYHFFQWVGKKNKRRYSFRYT